MSAEPDVPEGPARPDPPSGSPWTGSQPTLQPVMPPPPPPLTPHQVQDAALRQEAARLAVGHAATAPRDPATSSSVSLETRLLMLKAEVDGIQVQLMKAQSPWYRNVSALVAVLALLFSFGTTFVSYQRASQDDIHAAEIELRTLIARLAAIPAAMTEAAKTYDDDPATVTSLLSILNQEQLLVAKQAAQVLDSLPDDRVTAAQFLLVANVLLTNGIDTPGLDLTERALQRAGDVNDYTSAARVRAFRLFQVGRIDEGRGLYRQALGVFDRKGFESSDEYFKAYTHLQTRVGWAQAEFVVGNCEQARGQIDEARLLAARFPEADSQVRRMEVVAGELPNCRPGASQPPLLSPSPGLP